MPRRRPSSPRVSWVCCTFLKHTADTKVPSPLGELEKLGPKYRIALRIARDERWERLKCDHKGTYADDCLVDRVMKHRIYLVATNDRDLKRRIRLVHLRYYLDVLRRSRRCVPTTNRVDAIHRKIPGVPIVSVAKGKYVIERLPDAPDSR